MISVDKEDIVFLKTENHMNIVIVQVVAIISVVNIGKMMCETVCYHGSVLKGGKLNTIIEFNQDIIVDVLKRS